MSRLGIAALLSARPSRERDVVCAIITARILAPHTQLATTRWWHTTTLAEEFAVADATEDDRYAAMGWLLARQDRVQKRLARRHLPQGRPRCATTSRRATSKGPPVRWRNWATTAMAKRISCR